MENYIDSSPQK